MRLATYSFADGIGVGAVLDEEIADLRPIAGGSMRAFLTRGPEALAEAERVLSAAPREPLDHARLLAPVPDPGAFIGVGLNYRDHAAQIGRPLPERPAVFAKLARAVAPPRGVIPRDPAAPSLDYEGELGFVVGRSCRRITPAEAPDHIAGYVVVNDVTVRARVSPDTVMWAKGAPGHAPFGPWITTPDEVGDPRGLAIRTTVNGEPRQDGSTADMVFDCYAILAWLSEGLALMPGDVVTTGSPAGTGASLSPPRWLMPGNRVRVEIERLGAIEHVVENER